jgi:hypothetical protein
MPNSDMPTDVFREDKVALRAVGGNTTGDSAGRAIRGILVGVTEGKFREDSRGEDDETGRFDTGELLMEGKPL